MRSTFPDGFVWGVATAAFQIEGSTTADGRGPSIWDTFSARPGKVANGDTGDPAADHFRRMPEDVALMSGLGIGAYRFSVSWPRIMPDGKRTNPTGMDFYRRLVDELLEAGIRPWLTLYHWDLPQALEDDGGWTDRDTAYRFADYAAIVAEALGDRVDAMTTLNEPWCSAFLGHASGKHAPGRTEPEAAVAAAHHLLLAHGLGVSAIRESAPATAAGLTLNLFPVVPADPDEETDVEVARRVDGLQNRLFLDPALRGYYPDDLMRDLEPYGLSELLYDGDLDRIAQPLDFLGVNYYRDIYVSSAPEPAPSVRPSEWIGVESLSFPERGLPKNDLNWDVIPSGLTDLLLRLHEQYPGIPLYVTENGAAYPDAPNGSGQVDDPDRVSFIDGHLRAAHAAIERGVDLRGYFYWSLLDNFEWAEGYAKRFGLVHVDYTTQVRTPKASATWYAQVIAANAVGGTPDDGSS